MSKYKVRKNNEHYLKARPQCKQYSVLEELEPVAGIFTHSRELFTANTRKECNAWIRNFVEETA